MARPSAGSLAARNSTEPQELGVGGGLHRRRPPPAAEEANLADDRPGLDLRDPAVPASAPLHDGGFERSVHQDVEGIVEVTLGDHRLAGPDVEELGVLSDQRPVAVGAVGQEPR